MSESCREIGKENRYQYVTISDRCKKEKESNSSMISGLDD